MKKNERFKVRIIYRGIEKDYRVNFEFKGENYKFTFHNEPYPPSSKRQHRSFRNENTAIGFAEDLHETYPELTTEVIRITTIGERIKKFGK